MEHLSPREYVVVRLVAMGQSDEDIARKLRLSIRTIENTLASIYSKLGISARDEVASMLPRAASHRAAASRSLA